MTLSSVMTNKECEFTMVERLKKNTLIVAALANLVLFGPAFGQVSAEGLTLTVQISSPTAAKNGSPLLKEAPELPTVTVAAKKERKRAKKPPRYLQLSEDQIVVSLIDSYGKEIYRAAEHDPRVVRMEAADDQGQLSDGKFYLATAVDLSFTIPQVTEAETLMLLKPVWNGSEFTFDKLAEINIKQDLR